jgi:PERQ amino acid-rich with GYF domain-containing protein
VVLGHSNGRRCSTVHNSNSQVDVATPAPNVEIPTSQQVSNSFFDQPADHRYSKKQLLDLYCSQHSPDSSNKDVSSLFMNGWDPGHSNGANGRGWGKIVDTRDSHGPDVCWDATGSVQPINMEEMTEQELHVSRQELL